MEEKRFCYHSEYTYYLKDDFERIQSIIIQVKNDKFGSDLVDMADCKIKPNTLHKKTAETLMVID